MVVAHVYPKHMMGAVVSCFLSWSKVATTDGVHEAVGSGSWFMDCSWGRGGWQWLLQPLLLPGSSWDCFLSLAISAAASVTPSFDRWLEGPISAAAREGNIFEFN